jgi:CubicO group peptidase (beta-lactamase class C family)
MAEWAASGRASGVVAAIARRGDIVLRESTGYLDREKLVPIRPDTLFRVTSLTKSVTSAAFMTLVQEGRIRVEDEIQQFLPEFRGQRLWNGQLPARPITVRDVLTHCSGLVDSIPESFLTAAGSIAEVAAEAGRQALAFEPGSRWFYSNLGFITIGRLIETLSGGPYAEFVEHRLFRPLEMRDSFFRLPEKARSRVAVLYSEEGDALVREGEELGGVKLNFVSPGNGLYTTAGDILSFFQMILNGGEWNGRRVLEPEAVSRMRTVETGLWNAGFVPGAAYGLGLSIVREPLDVFRGHSLGTFGHGGFYQTHAWVDPAKELVSVFFAQHHCVAPISPELGELIELAACLGQERDETGQPVSAAANLV